MFVCLSRHRAYKLPIGGLELSKARGAPRIRRMIKIPAIEPLIEKIMTECVRVARLTNPLIFSDSDLTQI